MVLHAVSASVGRTWTGLLHEYRGGCIGSLQVYIGMNVYDIHSYIFVHGCLCECI